MSSGDRPGWSTIFYLIEFLDEVAFTLLIVALPLIRDEFDLDYAQIGLLLGLPLIASAFAEPLVLLLGDTGLRRSLILGGGGVLAAAFLLTASAETFPLLLVSLALSYPSSGAFVSLSQAELIDRNPGGETQVMARWTAAGTVGSLLGPAVLAGVLFLSGTWRAAVVGCAVATILLTLAAATTIGRTARAERPLLREIPGDVVSNLRSLAGRTGLWRWLALLPLADLLLDVFFGYLALFLTDVVGLPAEVAVLGTTLWLAAFLAGQIALPRLLNRVDGRKLLRASAAVALLAYPLWLLAPLPSGWRLGTVIALGLLTAPWYPVLKGEAYAAAPGRPATVGALESVVSSFGGLLAVGVGAAAAHFGLATGLLLLTLGPLSLVLLSPKDRAEEGRSSPDPRTLSPPPA